MNWNAAGTMMAVVLENDPSIVFKADEDDKFNKL